MIPKTKSYMVKQIGGACAGRQKVLYFIVAVALYSNVLRAFFGSWSTITSDIVLVVALISLCSYRWNPKHSKLLNCIFMSCLLLIILSVFEIANPNITNRLYSVIEFRKTFFQFIVLFVAYALFHSENSKSDSAFYRLIRFIVLISIPLIVYGIKQFFYTDSIDIQLYSLMDSDQYTSRYGATIRAISFFSGPFHYGMFCSIIFSLSMYLVFRSGKRRYYFVSMLSILGVYCSYTRTNFVCVAIVLCLALVIGGSDSSSKSQLSFNLLLRIFGVAVVALIAIALAWGVSSVDLGNDQLNSIVNSILNAQEDSRLAGRFTTWDEALQLFLQNPIIGNGMGAAGDTLSSFGVAINWVTAHNAFLKVLVELGVFGFVAFVVLIGSVVLLISRTTRGSHSGKFIFWSLFSVVLLNMALGSTLATFPTMTIIYILIGAQCKVYESSLCMRDARSGGDS